MAQVKFPFDTFETETAEQLREKMAEAGIDVPVSPDLSPLTRQFYIEEGLSPILWRYSLLKALTLWKTEHRAS